jgi:hypothetical protein
LKAVLKSKEKSRVRINMTVLAVRVETKRLCDKLHGRCDSGIKSVQRESYRTGLEGSPAGEHQADGRMVI